MTRRAIVVHDLAQAIAALRSAAAGGAPVLVLSSPVWAAAVGAAAFRFLSEIARDKVPGADAAFVLDCRDEPGRALNAFRHRLEAVCCDVTGPLRERLADIAAKSGSALVPHPPLALDLAEASDPEAACRRWLDL